MSELSSYSLAVIAAIMVVAGIVAGGLALLQRIEMRRKHQFKERIRAHFKPAAFEDVLVVGRTFPARVRADLQKVLEEVVRQCRTEHFCGVRQRYSFVDLSFSGLFAADDGDVESATPHYDDVDVGDDKPVRCLANGLWMIERDGAKLVLLMVPQDSLGTVKALRVEIAHAGGPAGDAAVEHIFKQIEQAIAQASSYRGKALSLESGDSYSGCAHGVSVHPLRTVPREEIILPRQTLDLLDRNTVRFAEQRAKLTALGLSARKGLLFYGPPGTGKTHTIHYLKHALAGHTFFLLTAEQQALLPEYMTLARLLQPSVIVMEDADLIARNRESAGPCTEGLLNRLLNEMDGLRLDAQILFILTTNRPDTLEEALMARPGRIDQAIEFPLPDRDCRERLLSLYASGLNLGDALRAKIVAETDGVSAAFIKELVRRSAQYALEAGRESSLDAPDVENALQELLHRGGSLNVKLLGGKIGLGRRPLAS